MRFTYPYAMEAAARLSAKVAIKKETTEPKMSKSSKSLSPAKAERRRQRAERRNTKEYKRSVPSRQAAGRSAIVKAALRIEKFHPWVVGLLCSSLVFGVLFVLGEQGAMEQTLLDVLRVLAILSMAAAGVIALFLLNSWYKAEQVDGFEIWVKGSLKTAIKNAAISEARHRS